MNHRLRPIAMIVTLALTTSLAALTVGAGAAPASAAESAPSAQPRPISVMVDGDVLDLTAVGSALVFGTRAAGSDQVTDPARVLLTVPDEQLHAAAIDVSAITAALPAGATAGDVTITLVSGSVPSGGGVQVRDGGTVVLGSAGGDPRTLTVAAGSRRSDSWLFSAPGRYVLEFTASVQVTTSDGTSATWTAPATTATIQVGGPTATATTLSADHSTLDSGATATLTATVAPADASGTVEFFDGATSLGIASVSSGKATHPAAGLAVGKHALTATFTPTAPAEYASSTAAAVTVRVGSANEPIQTAAKPAAANGAELVTLAPTALAAPADSTPVVLSSGNISITPSLTGVNLANKTFSGFDLGLLDKTGTYANQKWYSAKDAVLHLTDAEHDSATGLWQTPATPPTDANTFNTYTASRLVLGQDTATATGGINNANKNAIQAMPSGPGPITLVGATTPLDGRVRVFSKSGSVDNPAWDSTALATGHAQTALTSPPAVKTTYNGWAFDKAGTYCLTVSEQLLNNNSPTYTSVTEHATITVIVGDLPEQIVPCAQSDYTPGVGPAGDGVTRMTIGHLDVRSWINDAGDGLNFGIYDTTNNGIPTYTLSRNLVLGGTAQGTIPEPNNVSDLRFIAPVGSTYYYFKQAGDPSKELWPGFSGENWSNGKMAANQGLSTTLTGVAGPDGGQVILFDDPASTNDGASEPEYVFYNSAWGTPMTRTDLDASHTHMNWAFTKPGRYCLSVTTQVPLADGRTLSGSGQLTVLAGDSSNISSVIPCERDTTPTYDHTLPSPTPEAINSPVVSTQGLDEIQPYLNNGKLKASVQTRVQTAAAAKYYDPDDVIFSTRRKIGSYYQLSQDGSFSPTVSVRTDRISPQDVNGPFTVTMGSVQGPGPVYTSSAPGVKPMLNSATDGLSLSYTQPAQSSQYLAFRVNAAGVYCVPLTVSATIKNGSTASTSFTMTLVAGNTTDPSAADYVDVSRVTTCSRGQHGQAAGSPSSGGDSGSVGHDAIYVPNESLTDSGAVILNNGHVDVASKVSGDTLQTWVKDTTETSDARYHPLTGSNSLQSPDRNATNNGNGTVFQVLPEAQTSVPNGSTYGFLGASGSPLWQVNQTQQSGLLWPGWSTEDVPLAATQTGVTWTLDKMTGPGEFALYETGLTDVSVFFNTRDGITGADSYTIPKNAHVHGNWAFSAEGTYCLGFTRSTTMADGVKASDDFTLAVAVGRVDVKKVDPGKCFDTTGKPSSTDAAPVSDSQLTDVASGGVSVLDGGAGFFPGQLVSLKLGASQAGQWVSVWLHSPAVWLGWAKVDDTGVVQVRLPVGAVLGSHKLVVKSQAGGLLGWAGVSVVAPPVTDSGTQQTGVSAPVTQLAPQCTTPGVSVISAGHLDWNTQVIGGRLRSLIGDDSTGTRLYRDPATTVLWLKPSSQVSLPSGFGQVGAAGATVWQVPQTQNQDLIWLGWSTELLNAGNASSSVNWSLTQVDGPGTLKVYTIGSFGGLQEMVFNGPGTHTLPLGVHVHANWAFSAQGVYHLHFTQSATLANGQASSDSEVLTIAVGNANPATALSRGSGCGAVVRSVLATGQVAPVAGQAQAQADAGQAQDGTSSGGSQAARTDLGTASRRADSPVPLLLGVLGGLLLLAAAGTGILWWRRRNTA